MTKSTYILVLAFTVHALEEGIQRVIVGDAEDIISPRIAADLVFGELRIFNGHRFQQTILVDEGKEYDTLPSHFFAVHVNLKCGGIEVNNWRIPLEHEMMENVWDVLSATSGVSIEHDFMKVNAYLAAGKTLISCS